MANGSASFQIILFLIQTVVAVALLFGFRTRQATFFSWLFLVSLYNRNPAIHQSSDTLLRMLLFWSIFLPLGCAASVDCIRSQKIARTAPYLSMATAALLLQVAFVYIFTVMHKWGPAWSDASAVYYALSLEHYARPAGLTLVQYTPLLPVLTRLVYLFEAIGPFLLFMPYFFAPLRLILVAGFIMMHVGFFTFINVGHYPFVASVAMLPFLPSSFWSWFEKCVSPRLAYGDIRTIRWCHSSDATTPISRLITAKSGTETMWPASELSVWISCL